MTRSLSRRTLLSGLLAGTGSAAFGEAPLTSLRPASRRARPVSAAETLVEAAGLGGHVAYALADRATGEIIESRSPIRPMPPASTAKAPTAIYALDRLGIDHRFATRLVATGPIVNGRIEGDLVLQGSGDPVLDSDALGELAAALKAAGVREATGHLLVDDSALPSIPSIDADQPDHVGYNPAIGGLNLNFNRVHFEWKKGSAGYEVTMEARALKYRPGVQIARMEIVDRKGPVYTYEDRDGVDRWSVARKALGREGARWLPVRRPAEYAAEVFRTLARSHGIQLRFGGRGRAEDGTVLAEWLSPRLGSMLREMLDYSTNLTAEVAGLSASAQTGPPPETLSTSAARMNGWLNARLDARRPAFIDHSGLGYDSRITPVDMARVLTRGDGLEPLLENVRVEDAGVTVRAKTGTLNFVSALAGYMTPPGGRALAFAIFTADTARRDAIPIEQRERPNGARGWAGRSRTLQKKLLSRWAQLHAA